MACGHTLEQAECPQTNKVSKCIFPSKDSVALSIKAENPYQAETWQVEPTEKLLVLGTVRVCTAKNDGDCWTQLSSQAVRSPRGTFRTARENVGGHVATTAASLTLTRKPGFLSKHKGRPYRVLLYLS